MAGQYVKGIRTQLDEDFVKYLHYLLEKEKQQIRDVGMDPEREPSPWLMVSKLTKAFKCF
jgi:hypothetical protein